MKRKAIIAAGGTGGHIIPAISIANALEKEGIEILFVGNKNSMEREMITNYKFEGLDVQKLYRKLTLKHLLFPYKFLKNIFVSIKLIKIYRPDFFLGTGGFVSGPVGIAAYINKIPIFIQEQNSYPGLTNRVLGRIAKIVFIAYENAKIYFPKERISFSGNPVNPSLFTKEKINFKKYGMNENSFKIFLIGGSQGSVLLNKNFYPIVEDLLKVGIEIFWQTGRYDYENYKNIKKKGLYIFDFTNEIGKIYNSVNLVIGRAGAITLEELKWKKIPSILIPLRIAAGNHQFLNALEMFNKGVCEIISENRLKSEILYHTIVKMRNNIVKYQNCFEKIKMKNSSEFIARNIVKSIY